MNKIFCFASTLCSDPSKTSSNEKLTCNIIQTTQEDTEESIYSQKVSFNQ